MRHRITTLRRMACGLAVAGMATIGMAAIAAPQSGAASITKTTVSFDGTAGTPANYIFPFMTVAHFSVQNIDYFEYYMYRPLYMFGGKDSVTLDKRLSIGDTPVFSNGDKTIKITLKTYKWNDGESVTATDVLFWMNIWHQKPTGFAGWFPGGLSLPTSVAKITVTSPTTITFTMTTPMNPHWFLYNELSEITPLPIAWTRTSLTAAPGSAGCAKASFATTGTGGSKQAACKAVYDFLSEQSGFNPTTPKQVVTALPNYATNPLWGVVDGPWKLESFAPTSPYTMVPNPTYSGPNKPKVKKYVDETFTTLSAEYNALASGTLDIGQLPPTEITGPATSPGKPGKLPSPGKNNPRLTGTYTMLPGPTWEVNYFPYNFKSTGDTGQAGAIFSQLYFRQAMQYLVNQTLYVSRVDKGYGTPVFGPVPTLPKNDFTSSTELKNPYPYNPGKAKSLLSSHGWKVVKTGIDTCQKPGTGSGECGKGIKKGAKLAFTLPYITGQKSVSTIMQAEKDSWDSAGIHVTLSTATFNTIIGDAVPCPKGCSWEFENWGAGWIYSPDIYPDGTEILAGGAGSNDGDWITKTSTQLIAKTETGTTKLYKYENWEEKNLPVIWQPTLIPVWEVHKTLQGATPLNPLLTQTPATFSWK